MLKTAEAVSLGHPDKTCDYISSYILDRMIEQDENVRYAVEVMLKDNTVVLGGEIHGNVSLTELPAYVEQALADIGYTREYARRWGENTLNPAKLKIINLIGQQSAEIGQGVAENGWGDQGVFVGYACQGEGHVSREQFLARRLNRALYDYAGKNPQLGLDIKTQVTVAEDGSVVAAVAAVPMLRPVDLKPFVCEILGSCPATLIINGTGCYRCHSSVADCGVTGRKLACDFYETSAPVGGGSPWTKDASKADLTLNLYARRLALSYLRDNDECFVYLSSCIGRSDLPSAEVKTVKNGKADVRPLNINKTPNEIIAELGLNKPVFAELCREGLW